MMLDWGGKNGKDYRTIYPHTNQSRSCCKHTYLRCGDWVGSSFYRVLERSCARSTNAHERALTNTHRRTCRWGRLTRSNWRFLLTDGGGAFGADWAIFRGTSRVPSGPMDTPNDGIGERSDPRSSIFIALYSLRPFKSRFVSAYYSSWSFTAFLSLILWQSGFWDIVLSHIYIEV